MCQAVIRVDSIIKPKSSEEIRTVLEELGISVIDIKIVRQSHAAAKAGVPQPPYCSAFLVLGSEP